MDEEQFRHDTMVALARVELALKHLVDRIATVESSCNKQLGEITAELRRCVAELKEDCNRKRKNLLENMTSADVRGETACRELVDGLEVRVRALEERVMGVEREAADKTTTKTVISLEHKIDSLRATMGELKVDVARLDVRIKAVEEAVRDMRDNGWKKIQTALTILALIVSMCALSFNVIKEVITGKQTHAQAAQRAPSP